MPLFKVRKAKPLSFVLKKHSVDRVSHTWTSKNGSKTYVSDMNDVHLENTIKLVKKGDHNSINTSSEIYKLLVKEKEYRTWR